MKKPIINFRALDKISSGKIKPIVQKEALRRIREQVRAAHREMLMNFENHLITREIDHGPEANNESGTLGGYGNLFSYIGFEYGSDPIAPVRKILKKALKIRSLPSPQRSMIMKFEVELPSKEEIFENTPKTWATGRSWVEGIERGISGLGKYLKIDSRKGVASRSGAGLQVKNGPMSGSFRNTKYLSQILNDLRSSIVRKTK